MASLILSTAGNAAFGPIGGFLGALAGTAIDSLAISALTPARVQPSRLAGLKVQASQEGTPIPIFYGRFRVTGQVIWASKFREISDKRTVGGKGGQRVVDRTYTISFAIGLCQGPVDGMGQVWANGNLLDLSMINHRLYHGGEHQMPDPLIEALEGLGDAPAFRGLAYIVFEDFALGAYGDRIPQFGFEVMASPNAGMVAGARLKDLAQAVCLIPGAGEFTYATTPHRKILSTGAEVGENIHAQAARSDFDVSIDNLQRDLPNVKNVSLVVAWFGTDLRADMCEIVPKVEDPTKITRPRAWSVAGLTRAHAGIVSQSGGKPAYGGSPEDHSVIESIVGLKARGFLVTHNPFVMMDIAADNNLPNPNGGPSQAPYPWRGRITCFPAIGTLGTVDGTPAATAQINAFFGTAAAAHFSVIGQTISYSGPSQWSYRRFVLQQAALTKAAGGVSAFVIGSELIGLTRVRGIANSFPAVSALIALADEVRALLGPDVKITYGADWTEYGAYSPPGTNNLHFPLDPLWAHPNIDLIGLDWYAPLSDRREGEPRATVSALKDAIEGEEGYDFYYADDAARAAKSKTPITDGAYQENWVWRQKDIRAFWSNPHFERINGMRASAPTVWVPQSKPMALMELGFPAVNKGANRPSVFPDPKSVESGLPPFSTGTRDDVEQRLALEATLSYWLNHNPPSNLYSGNMLDMANCFLWAWDARPYPYFPARTDVWADGAYAMLGHWLAGRAGALSLGELVSDICARAGMSNVDTGGVSGFVDGFAVEAPSSARGVLENLFLAFGLEARSYPNAYVIRDAPAPLAQIGATRDRLLVRDARLCQSRTTNVQGAPSAGRFTSYSIERDFQPATHITAMTGQTGPINALASSLVLDATMRQQVADRLARRPSSDTLQLSLSPALSAKLEAGDRIATDDGSVWRVDRLEGQFSMTALASRAPDMRQFEQVYTAPQSPVAPILYSPPILAILDMTAPLVSSNATGPLVGCASALWPGEIDVLVNGRVLANVTKPMTIGSLAQTLNHGPVARIINRPITINVKFGGQLPGTGHAALLSGEAVSDVISWRSATLIGEGLWRLSDWVRGLNGANDGVALPTGTTFVLLDDALRETALDPNLIGATLDWLARPSVDTARTTVLRTNFLAISQKPWSVCHVSAKRTSVGAVIKWTRRARGNGDGWAASNAPLGAARDVYRVSILSPSGAIVRTSRVQSPTYIYESADETADFGAPQSALRVELLQIGDDERDGVVWTGVVAAE